MSSFCEDRVSIATSAARGLGREYALLLASHGAKVVVNDLGGEGGGKPCRTVRASDSCASMP
jgi:NAD(P)-dependent dehydrogenase (short-subunit alcohol dehydrogenase family)